MSSTEKNINKDFLIDSFESPKKNKKCSSKEKEDIIDSNKYNYSNNKSNFLDFSSNEKSINLESPYKNCLTNELIKSLNFYSSYKPKNKETINQIDSIQTFNNNNNSQITNFNQNYLGNKIIRPKISFFNSYFSSSTNDNKSFPQSFNSYYLKSEIEELDKQLDYINYSLKNILPKSFQNLNIKDESKKFNSFQFISCFNNYNQNNNKRNISEFSLNFNNIKYKKNFNNLNIDNNNNLNNLGNNKNLNENIPNQFSFMSSNNKKEDKQPIKKRKKIEKREGDWICHKCNNLNFSFRNSCNKCKSLKMEMDKFNEEKTQIY